jgi:hypothetical protein
MEKNGRLTGIGTKNDFVQSGLSRTLLVGFGAKGEPSPRFSIGRNSLHKCSSGYVGAALEERRCEEYFYNNENVSSVYLW